MNTHTTNPNRRFVESALAQAENIRAWVFLMVLSLVGRLIWLHVNWAVIDESVTTAEWGRFFQMGLRYDSVAVTYMLLPFFAMGALLYFAPDLRQKLGALRTGWVIILTFAMMFLAFANASYFEFNNTVFDSYIFEFFNGNAQDAVNTAIQEHNAVRKVLVSVVLATLAIVIYRRWCAKPLPTSSWISAWFSRRTARILTTICIAAFIGVALRGRVGTRPLQRIDTGATTHRVLNLGSLHPIFNLKTAWYEHKVQVDFYNEDRILPPETLQQSVAMIARCVSCSKVVFSESSGPASDEFTLPIWQRQASGPPAAKPSHVFVLFMESYDSWPFLEENRELELVEEGRKLGDKGHRLMSYLPGANGSLLSSLVCLQGLFDTNRLEQQCLPTSVTHAFNRLGYITRSVNGFGSEWSDSQRIAQEQGFDEIYCTAEIKPDGDTSNFQLHDRTLLEFTADRLSYDQPTFSFIRSSSYHGPFEVDLEAEDCVVESIPERLRKPGLRDEAQLCHGYGTLKYSDKMLGEFVRKMSARFPNSLFVITGDHYGRHYLTTDPPIYEGSSVPLILYGPAVLAGTELPTDMAASHVDLTTTLIELCAPEGFAYTSLGKNILQPAQDTFGVGKDFVIFPEAVVCLRGTPDCTLVPWKKHKQLSEDDRQALIRRAREIHDAYHGVGYMMSRRALLYR